MIMTWIRLWINLKEFYRATSSYYRDDAVEIDAAVAMNRQGGGRRRKLTDLAVDQVIQKKKMNLFCPINLSNHCVSLFVSLVF